MDIQKEFKKWLKEICRWDRDDWFIDWKSEQINIGDYEYRGKVWIYTVDNVYGIVALKRKEKGKKDTYLGCTVSKRKPRAGETWTRGNDLADGEFNRKTWDRIKNDIIGYELVKFIKTKD